jgi:hypothetical protein
VVIDDVGGGKLQFSSFVTIKPIPANQRVLGWIAQLANRRAKTLSELDVELGCSNSIFA